MVLPFILFFVFSLCERKNENKKKIKYHAAAGYDGSFEKPIA